MMQTEGTRMSAEDRRYLEEEIKILQRELDEDAAKQQEIYDYVCVTPERAKKIAEIRRLRRLRK